MRLKSTDATVRVADTGSYLLVQWDAANADIFEGLRHSFGLAFWRRGEAQWQRDEGGWSVPYRYQKRLNKWIAHTFDADAVTWEQEPSHHDDAAGAEGADRSGTDRDLGTRRTAVDLIAAYEMLHLLPSAPPELVTAAYRYAARVHHPDHGGDDAAMVRLNAAVECIRAHHARLHRQS